MARHSSELNLQLIETIKTEFSLIDSIIQLLHSMTASSDLCFKYWP